MIEALAACAAWVDSQAVIRPSAPGAAAAERLSIGATATRWLATSCVTTTSQSAKKSSAKLSTPKVQTVLVPAPGNSSVSSLAASRMSTTGGRAS